jgi:hypothetical protein
MQEQEYWDELALFLHLSERLEQTDGTTPSSYDDGNKGEASWDI